MGLALALVALPTEVRAQEAAHSQEAEGAPATDDLSVLVERMNALTPVVEEEIRARRIARGMEFGFETTRFNVGLLSVVSRVDQQDLVSSALAEALPFYAQTVAGGAEHVLSDGDWIVQFYDAIMPADLGAWSEDVELVEIKQEDGARRMSTRTRELMGQRLVARLPAEAREWLGGAPLMRPGPDAGFTWGSLHREAVTAGSSAVRDCMDGQAARCWSVLGFPNSESRALEWYSEDEIRLRAVMDMQNALRGSRRFRRGDGSVDQEAVAEARGLLAQCRGGAIESCLRMQGGWVHHRAPLPHIARTSLLWHALEQGGEGAYARFWTATDEGVPVPQALAAAARMYPDELVAGWGHRLNEARPAGPHNLGLAGLSSLLWFLSFAGIAVRAAQRGAS